MNTKIKEQPVPEWFNGQIYDKGDIVANRFTGEEIELNNVELSMYDFVMGASIVIEMGMFNTPQHVQDLRKGLAWFMKYNPEAYMVLLD
tara:strand:+ start:1171 stop:1437 length:267 start_codon:yes stop_codon:yes gene_type:complete